MTTYRSLNHTKWHCQYHVVFIPKYCMEASGSSWARCAPNPRGRSVGTKGKSGEPHSAPARRAVRALAVCRRRSMKSFFACR